MYWLAATTSRCYHLAYVCRIIGACERAVELMCARVDNRTAFGKKLSEQGGIQDAIAESRMDVCALPQHCVCVCGYVYTPLDVNAHTPVAVACLIDFQIEQARLLTLKVRHHTHTHANES